MSHLRSEGACSHPLVFVPQEAGGWRWRVDPFRSIAEHQGSYAASASARTSAARAKGALEYRWLLHLLPQKGGRGGRGGR